MISFDVAYQWLNQFDRSYLTSATSAIAAQLAGHFHPFTREGAKQWMQRLTDVSTSIGQDEEMAEAYVVCAYAAYRFNSLRDAAGYLQAAVPLYGSHFHQTAVVKWLLGMVYWARTSQEDGRKALMLYNEAIEQFQRLQVMYLYQYDRRAVWYAQALAEMRAAAESCARSLDLRQSLFQDTLPAANPAPVPVNPPPPEPSAPPPEPAGDATARAAPGTQADWQPEFDQDEYAGGMRPEMPPQPPIQVEEPHTPPNGAQEFPAPDIYSQLFQMFPVSDSIPAGGLGPLGYDPNPAGYMQIDRVVIDGCLYRIRPLKRNGNLINLTGYLRAGLQLTLLRVKGESMNRLVQDGEYVLVLLQNTANDGDIVVAGFTLESTEATLKRYNKRGNQVTLMPESTHPDHQNPITIEANQPGFNIIGIALAVLTPVDE